MALLTPTGSRPLGAANGGRARGLSAAWHLPPGSGTYPMPIRAGATRRPRREPNRWPPRPLPTPGPRGKGRPCSASTSGCPPAAPARSGPVAGGRGNGRPCSANTSDTRGAFSPAGGRPCSANASVRLLIAAGRAASRPLIQTARRGRSGSHLEPDGHKGQGPRRGPPDTRARARSSEPHPAEGPPGKARWGPIR